MVTPAIQFVCDGIQHPDRIEGTVTPLVLGRQLRVALLPWQLVALVAKLSCREAEIQPPGHLAAWA